MLKPYIQYYNQDRLHTANGDLSPICFELSKEELSYLTLPEIIISLICLRIFYVHSDVSYQLPSLKELRLNLY